MTTAKPALRPANPNFSSGPCAKRPGFTLDALARCLSRRSHRAAAPKARLAEVIERSRAILGMPADWRLGIVPASDTGAMEMALWSLLGPRGVDVLAFESFSEGWATDVVKQLRLPDARVLSAPYGRLPDLTAVDFTRDVVLAWNGTTSGVRVPERRLDPGDARGARHLRRDLRGVRDGAALGQARCRHLVLAEGAGRRGGAWHARAVAARRRPAGEPYARLADAEDLPADQGRQADRGDLQGRDDQHALDAVRARTRVDGLRWAESVGGLPALIARAEANLAAVAALGRDVDMGDFLAEDAATRSCTSICLQIVALVPALTPARQAAKHRRAAGEGGRRLRHRRLSRRAAGPAHLGRRDGRDRRHRGAAALARLGVRRSRGRDARRKQAAE